MEYVYITVNQTITIYGASQISVTFWYAINASKFAYLLATEIFVLYLQ